VFFIFFNTNKRNFARQLPKMSKKILVVTYYWFPAGGPGVQRWTKFVKYLPDFSIEPIVYIPENPNYPIIDKQTTEDFSKIKIIKHPIKEPSRFFGFSLKGKTKKISSGIIPNREKQSFLDKILLYIRGNFFIPDARIYWVKPSVSFLEKYIVKHKIETIITTGPPHSLHLIGLGLKERLNIEWIADFRDPWTSIVYHKELKLSKKSTQKHKELEQKVLQTADKIIVTSPSLKTEFSQITSSPIQVITNGYDVEQIEKQTLDKKFSIAHIGSFLSERNPIILWKILGEIITENKEFKNDLELKIAGIISQEISDTIEKFGLTSFVKNLGYLRHKDAVVEQRKSQILLLVESDSEETKMILPGKLYEYMASHRPILAIANQNSDIKKLITQTNTGVFCSYSEEEKLKQTIINYHKTYKENNLKTYPIGLQFFSRKKLTEKLADLLTNNH